MTLWPCTTCGADGVRNLGTEGFCAIHLAQLYGRFDPAVFELNGVGLPGASSDPTFLTCCACGAGWTGVAGEACAWCAVSLLRMQEWAIDAVLTAPDVDPDDARFAPAVEAWAERLWAAVKAELITERQAESALRRGVRQRVA